jgi:hypothetical protein
MVRGSLMPHSLVSFRVAEFTLQIGETRAPDQRTIAEHPHRKRKKKEEKKRKKERKGKPQRDPLH